MPPEGEPRRRFLKRTVMGACGAALGAAAVRDLLQASKLERGRQPGALLGDGPAAPGPWAREAAWYETRGGMAHCVLCPHECRMADGDRGFCLTRAAMGGKLYTLAYGNPCSVHLDPMEKKPLYHFLPGQPVLSIATAGCNLRCLNCQNWEISQRRPEDTDNQDLPPAALVEQAARNRIPALAYTYSEPIAFYEYTRDTAAAARERGVRNVLVTAGFILEEPLRALCRVTDAANVDLKAFGDPLYRELTQGRLQAVLRCLEVMREEGVWLEVTRLVVPRYSDDLDDIRRMSAWLAAHLGPDVPLHLSRFHPAYRLQRLPLTPVEVLDEARRLARAEGLHHVYVGNVPGHEAQDTVCPRCGEKVIERQGYQIRANRVRDGRCPCGAAIPGVWS